MPLPVGTCETCNAENEKLRPHPFYPYETCQECRTEHPDYAIIGVTDIKKEFKLKESDLIGLAMATEPKPKFLGGPDKRWYKLSQVERKAEEAAREKEEKKKAALEKNKKKKEPKEISKSGKKEGDAKERAPRKAGAKASAEAERGVDMAAPVKRKRLARTNKVKAVNSELTEDEEDAVEEPKKKRGRPAKAAKI